MRECQLCGVKSWGPLQQQGRVVLLNAFRPEDREVDFTAYRQCDNCGMPAQVRVIEKPSVDIPDLPDGGRLAIDAIFGGPPPLDPITAAMPFIEKMMGRQSERETRLERLVRAILGAPTLELDDAALSSESIAAKYVNLARFMEFEIDKEI
jgi:hypothetical protein